jgi:hypothetical protein
MGGIGGCTVVAMRFHSTVELGGKTATGIAVPVEVAAALGSGKRPPVRVTVGGHCYRTTVASMNGRFFVPLNADDRSAAGVAAGDAVDVEIVTDTAPSDVSVPDDLAGALAGDPTAAAFCDGLSYTHRKEWVRWIEDAKTADTRSSRLTTTVASLHVEQRSR